MRIQFWRKTHTWLILAGFSVGIILIEILIVTIMDRLGKGAHVNDDLVQSIIFLICFPGIIVGLTGALICSFHKK